MTTRVYLTDGFKDSSETRQVLVGDEVVYYFDGHSVLGAKTGRPYIELNHNLRSISGNAHTFVDGVTMKGTFRLGKHARIPGFYQLGQAEAIIGFIAPGILRIEAVGPTVEAVRELATRIEEGSILPTRPLDEPQLARTPEQTDALTARVEGLGREIGDLKSRLGVAELRLAAWHNYWIRSWIGRLFAKNPERERADEPFATSHLDAASSDRIRS